MGILSAAAPAVEVEAAAVAAAVETAAGIGEESTALAGRSMSGTAAAEPVPETRYTAAAMAAAAAGIPSAGPAADIRCIAAAMAAVRSPWAAAQRGPAVDPAAGQAQDRQRNRHTAAVQSPGEDCCLLRRRSSWNTSSTPWDARMSSDLSPQEVSK